MASGVMDMTFSGPFRSAFPAMRAAEEAGFPVELIKAPWHDEALIEAFVELVEVCTESPVPEDWGNVVLARAQEVMEPHNFRLRSHGSPVGRAILLPKDPN